MLQAGYSLLFLGFCSDVVIALGFGLDFRVYVGFSQLDFRLVNYFEASLKPQQPYPETGQSLP